MRRKNALEAKHAAALEAKHALEAKNDGCGAHAARAHARGSCS